MIMYFRLMADLNRAVSKAKLKYGVTIPRNISAVGRRKPRLPIEQLPSQESDKSSANEERGESSSLRGPLSSTDRTSECSSHERGDADRTSIASSLSAADTPPVMPISLSAPFPSGKPRKSSLRNRGRGTLRPMDSVWEREERHLTFDDEHNLTSSSRSRSLAARNVARFSHTI